MKLKNLNLKRLILVDLDGTVLQKDGVHIHPKTLEVLQKASDDGHIVCILTGRPHAASIQHYNKLKLNTLIANFDGAHIHDPIQKKFKRIVLPISNEIKNEILANPIIQEKVINVLVEYYENAMLFKKDKEIEDFFHLKNHDGTGALVYGNPLTEWDSPTNNIILKVKNRDDKDEVIRILSKFGDAVKIQSDNLYGIVKSEGDHSIISLTNKLANKGFAAEILAQYYNKDLRDTIAFGDQMNDYHLITRVGHGIAMKNGSENLKIIADGITYKTNDEGGVGYYLEQLLEGKEL